MEKTPRVDIQSSELVKQSVSQANSCKSRVPIFFVHLKKKIYQAKIASSSGYKGSRQFTTTIGSDSRTLTGSGCNSNYHL